MDTAEMKKRQLLEAAEEKLVMLENAKRRLYQNSSELKSQIHSQMSRFLEALRNREVQLLNQVDQLQTQREEALHKQHAVLSRSLGQLQRAAVASEEEKSLHGKFEKLSLNDLLPEELPYMTFKATPVGLNDVLMNFGRITANGVPLPDNRSASLPKQFEDYGDAEHHILYKTVEKIQQGPNSEKKIFVKIPRLTSSNTSEWLAKKSSVLTTVAPPSPDSYTKCMFAPFRDTKFSGWLAENSSPPTAQTTTVPQPNTVCLPQMTKNTSIQRWLHQIKQNPDNEEDGFEMLELNSDGDTDSIEIVSSSPPSVTYGPQYKTAGDKRCHDSDNSQWLSSPKRKVMAIEKPASIPTFSYFKKLAEQDLSIWLAKKKSNSSVSKSNCCSTNDVIVPKNCDIENLGDSACIEKLTKNLKTFSRIIKEPCNEHDENKGSLLPPVSSLCKANEICEKYSECLSKPNCIEQKWSSNKPESLPEKNSLNRSNSLSPTKSSSCINKKIDVQFGPFLNKSEMSVWLQSKKDKENVPVGSFSLKNASSSQSLNDWLIKPNDKKPVVFSAKFRHHGKDINTWLAKPTANETCMLRE